MEKIIVKDIKELDGLKRGLFSIHILEVNNLIVLVREYKDESKVVYQNKLDNVNKVLEVLNYFGLNVALEKRVFKIVFSYDTESVVLTSKDASDESIERFRNDERYKLIEIEL